MARGHDETVRALLRLPRRRTRDRATPSHPWAKEAVPDPNVNMVRICGTGPTAVYAIGYDPIHEGAAILHSSGAGSRHSLPAMGST
jgi:hypothetical protein